MEKCRKKLDAIEKQDDIGEDAIALAVKRSGRSKRKEEGNGK